MVAAPLVVLGGLIVVSPARTRHNTDRHQKRSVPQTIEALYSKDSKTAKVSADSQQNQLYAFVLSQTSLMLSTCCNSRVLLVCQHGKPYGVFKRPYLERLQLCGTQTGAAQGNQQSASAGATQASTTLQASYISKLC